MRRLAIIATLAIGSFGCIGYGAGLWFARDNQTGENQTGRVLAGPANPHGHAASASAPYLVRVETITVPIQRQNSVIFVVADFAVAVVHPKYVARYQRPAYSARLRAEIMDAMQKASKTAVFLGPTIESATLSSEIRTQLQNVFEGVDDVLTLMLYKHDIGY
ncbi:hypothetical protein [Roseinatronobacter sp.]|uniref:hypothetical protein n=1 Tax=Roseinatronobacter sp. TaxID=1945755 RepID=UPI0025E4F7B8|nr:hypothetical protein [Rhodobaca sp.]